MNMGPCACGAGVSATSQRNHQVNVTVQEMTVNISHFIHQIITSDKEHQTI